MQGGTPFTPVSLRYCRNITAKILKYPVAIYFSKPVNPIEENVPDYFEKIKRPMDLGTVLDKLDKAQYPTIDKWKEEMTLIWTNAMLYNGIDHPIHIIAKELREKFRSLSEHIPRNNVEEWALSCQKKHEKLMRLIDFQPEISQNSQSTSQSSNSNSKKKVLFSISNT